MELQLLKQLKNHILRGLTQLPLTKFNQLSKLKKPNCLFSAQSALEVLFSVSGTQLFQKMQQFESLTFQFEFKKERIFKAKKHLLNYLSEKQQNEAVPESLTQSIINYVSLIENLVAFAEVHYLSIKNFSNLMQIEMNKNQQKQQQIQNINNHLSKVTKIQKEIKETVLQLPLEDIKIKQNQPDISETNLIKEDSQDNYSESEIISQQFTNDPKKLELKQEENQQTNALKKQLPDSQGFQLNQPTQNSQNAAEITLESREPIYKIEQLQNQSLYQTEQTLQKLTESDQQENSENFDQKQANEAINQAEHNQDDNNENNDNNQQKIEISSINSNQDINNKTISEIVQDSSLPIQPIVFHQNSTDEQTIKDILQQSPLESLDTLPKNRFVQSNLSPNRVSIKMAVLQNLVHQSLFIKSKPEVDCFQEKLDQNAIQDLIQRPIRQVRSRVTQPFIQVQESVKKSLFNLQ